MMKRIVQNFNPWMAAILLGALIFRLLLWKWLRLMVEFDEANYLRMAGQMGVDGVRAVLHPYWAPGYPFVAGCMHALVRNLEVAARIINVLSGVGVVWIVYLWTKRVFNVRTACVSSALFAFWPEIAFMNTDAMPESLYTLLALAGLYVFACGLQRASFFRAIVSGSCLAGAYLMKPEGIVFVPVVLLIAVVHMLRSGFLSEAKIQWPRLTVFGLVFVSLSLPYWIFLKEATGAWTISSKGPVNQQMESAVYFNDGEVKDPFFHLTSDLRLPYDMAMHFGNLSELAATEEGRARIENIPLRKYAVKYVTNLHEILQHGIPRMLGVILLVLIVIGLFAFRLSAENTRFVLPVFIAIGFFWGIVVPLFHVNLRYLRPLLPLLFIWAGHGARILHNRIRENEGASPRRGMLRKSVMVMVVFIGLGYLPELGRVMQRRHITTEMWDQAVELKEAALRLKSDTGYPPRLMTLNKAVDFYAGQTDMTAGASFSYDPIPMNVAYAKSRDVDYLVFSSRYIPWFNNLAGLITRDHHEGIVRVYHRKEANGIETVIYKVIH